MKWHRSWRQISSGRKSILFIFFIVQLGLFLAALRSIIKRSPLEIRGRKIWWILISMVNYVGPITYFVYGRIKPDIRKDFL